MPDEPIEIKLDNKAVEEALLKVAQKASDLRPLMKNIAGIMADSTEENFKEEGRPKWQDLCSCLLFLSQKNKNCKKKNWTLSRTNSSSFRSVGNVYYNTI